MCIEQEGLIQSLTFFEECGPTLTGLITDRQWQMQEILHHLTASQYHIRGFCSGRIAQQHNTFQAESEPVNYCMILSWKLLMKDYPWPRDRQVVEMENQHTSDISTKKSDSDKSIYLSVSVSSGQMNISEKTLCAMRCIYLGS